VPALATGRVGESVTLHLDMTSNRIEWTEDSLGIRCRRCQAHLRGERRTRAAQVPPDLRLCSRCAPRSMDWREREDLRPTTFCSTCGGIVENGYTGKTPRGAVRRFREPTRSDKLYCKDKCRQAAYRRRRAAT
jgi:hypothetical protein